MPCAAMLAMCDIGWRRSRALRALLQRKPGLPGCRRKSKFPPEEFQAAKRVINWRMPAAGIAPACLPASVPFLKTARVGIELIRNLLASSGNCSVFTLVINQLPARSEATWAISGATFLQGGHQGAQKSTRTGSTEWLVAASKAAALLISTGSA